MRRLSVNRPCNLASFLLCCSLLADHCRLFLLVPAPPRTRPRPRSGRVHSTRVRSLPSLSSMGDKVRSAALRARQTRRAHRVDAVSSARDGRALSARHRTARAALAGSCWPRRKGRTRRTNADGSTGNAPRLWLLGGPRQQGAAGDEKCRCVGTRSSLMLNRQAFSPHWTCVHLRRWPRLPSSPRRRSFRVSCVSDTLSVARKARGRPGADRRAGERRRRRRDDRCGCGEARRGRSCAS